MARFILTYGPLIGKHRLDDPTKDITNRTVGVISDPEAAEWLRGMMVALQQVQSGPMLGTDMRHWIERAMKQSDAALKGDRHD